jgi:hypothetical protein
MFINFFLKITNFFVYFVFAPILAKKKKKKKTILV